MKIRSLTIILALAAPVRADERVDYATRIKPVLQSRCYACHGVLKQKGGLRLDKAAFAKKGGENGPAIEPGDAGSSPLIDRVTAPDGPERMPPEGERLKPEEVAALRSWIAQGAGAPPTIAPSATPATTGRSRPRSDPPSPAVRPIRSTPSSPPTARNAA